MIRLLRHGVIAPGKVQDAMAFAHKIAGMVTKATGATCTPSVRVGGRVGDVYWTTEYKDMAALQAGSEKLLADGAFNEEIASAADLFIAGSFEDVILRDLA
ncbi:MAG: hypothetical protein NVSMB13_02230 [Mycobacteriales bacterium]